MKTYSSELTRQMNTDNSEICTNCAAGLFSQCENRDDHDSECYKYFMELLSALSGRPVGSEDNEA
ncbi:hypothetical protein [uncultured Paraglaciecola sp.]|uniref:hypothetical protein n=1 Tax=uncultured Paraglaciecola sp. TaxID=1765024 RepID=UPI00260FC438|nr:hypothetical protein [uncultured Paraglaciecola sp.]